VQVRVHKERSIEVTIIVFSNLANAAIVISLSYRRYVPIGNLYVNKTELYHYVQVGTWNDGINFTAPLSHANSAVVFANKTLRVTTILVRGLTSLLNTLKYTVVST